MSESNKSDSVSNRRGNWISFGAKVGEHIDTYIVPEIGDRFDDETDEYTFEICMEAINALSTRFGDRSNPTQDKFDCIKIAYFAQLAYLELEKKEGPNYEYRTAYK